MALQIIGWVVGILIGLPLAVFMLGACFLFVRDIIRDEI